MAFGGLGRCRPEEKAFRLVGLGQLVDQFVQLIDLGVVFQEIADAVEFPAPLGQQARQQQLAHLQAAVVGFATVIVGPFGLGDEVFVGVEADEAFGRPVAIAEPQLLQFLRDMLREFFGGTEELVSYLG